MKVGEKTPTQLGPLERANLNHLRTDTDPVSETLCSLEYQTMEKVQKSNNSVCYTPSSEPFRTNPIGVYQLLGALYCISE
jgi:hypothetical protein